MANEPKSAQAEGSAEPAEAAATPESSVAADSELTPPDEPLAELGVTPIAKDDEADKALEEPAQSIRQVQGRTQ